MRGHVFGSGFAKSVRQISFPSAVRPLEPEAHRPALLHEVARRRVVEDALRRPRQAHGLPALAFRERQPRRLHGLCRALRERRVRRAVERRVEQQLRIDELLLRLSLQLRGEPVGRAIDLERRLRLGDVPAQVERGDVLGDVLRHEIRLAVALRHERTALVVVPVVLRVALEVDETLRAARAAERARQRRVAPRESSLIDVPGTENKLGHAVRECPARVDHQAVHGLRHDEPRERRAARLALEGQEQAPLRVRHRHALLAGRDLHLGPTAAGKRLHLRPRACRERNREQAGGPTAHVVFHRGRVT